MKNFKKIGVFLITVALLCSLFSITALAAAPENEGADNGKLDMDMTPESFGDRLEYALQGTVTGMLMVFGVLTLLTLILYGSKYVFYDIPNKRNPKPKKLGEVNAETMPGQASEVSEAYDNGELAAVITAAIAAMIESGESKEEFANGFRVVSFKRSEKNAWNRK